MFYDLFCDLCKEKGISVTKATVEIGLSRTIGTKWKRTGATPNGETLNRIADYFGVSTDYLLGAAAQKEKPAPMGEPNGLPELNKKDERDIARQLDSMLGQLDSPEGALMFDGEPLDDETRELLRISLQNQLELTKQLAKAKFTPKKYRKD